MPFTISRPESDEFAASYASFVAAVPEGDVIEVLATQLTHTLALLRYLPESQGDFRYQPDKWSVKDVICHLADCERFYAYRALRIARNDHTALSGFDQNAYVTAAHAGRRSLSALLDDFEAIRHATLTLLRSFDMEMSMRRGVAGGNTVSVRALAYITAGHERHHVQMLQDRYGVK